MSVDHSCSRPTISTPGVGCPSVMVSTAGPKPSCTGVVPRVGRSGVASVGAASCPASGTGLPPAAGKLLVPPAPPAPGCGLELPELLQPAAGARTSRPTRTDQTHVPESFSTIAPPTRSSKRLTKRSRRAIDILSAVKPQVAEGDRCLQPGPATATCLFGFAARYRRTSGRIFPKLPGAP